MGSFRIQKWCIIYTCVLMVLTCADSFRLIHTSHQSHEAKRPNIKELTKKVSELKSGKDTFLNDSVTLHFETLKKPEEGKRESVHDTPMPSVKKIKTIQPALPPNISKQHLLHRFKFSKLTTKTDDSDKVELDKSEEEEIKLPASVEKSEPRNKTAKTVVTKLKESTKSLERNDYVKSVETKDYVKPVEKETKHISEGKVSGETKRMDKIFGTKVDKDKDISDSTMKPEAGQMLQDAKTLIKERIQKITKSAETHTVKESSSKISKISDTTMKPKSGQMLQDAKIIIKERIQTIAKSAESGKIKETLSKITSPKSKPAGNIQEEKQILKMEVKASEEKKDKLVSAKKKPETAKQKSKLFKDVKPVEKPAEKSKTLVKQKKVIVSTIKKTTIHSKPTNLYYNIPSFAINLDVIENESCKKQGQVLIDQLNARKLWALKMIDSTAKIPSGILKGNLNQFGDYDQCVGIFVRLPNDNKTSSDIKISGKYCLADIDIQAKMQEMKLPVNMAQGRALVRSKSQDPGHFAPRFTTIRWALCVPSGCTAEDAESFLEDSLKMYHENNIGFNFNVSVKPDQCNTKKLPKKLLDYSYGVLGTIGFTIVLMVIVLLATIRDIRLEENQQVEVPQDNGTIDNVFMSFSLKRTMATLLKRESEPDDIECIHGIRTICTFLLYLGHRLIPLGHIPFTNKVYLTEVANHSFSMLLRVSVIYTDSFLLLSGVLTSYRMSKDMEVKGHIPWFNRIFARYVRLTPSLAVVLLYYAYIMELLGEGPLWNTIVTPNARLCQENGWKNLLYIQNIYPFQDMCATHTHQLALDMQLSLIAPILVWLLYRRPFMGVVTTLLFHCISVILRYYSTINYRLSLIIYHGISLSQLYRTANLLYASSVHRATPYLAGVGLGVLLRQMNPDFHMPKPLALFGWLTSSYFAIWTFYTPSHLASRSYQYDLYEAAQYAALCSLAWSLALSWIIFASFADSQGYINSFLSSRPMVLFSRISYTLYLTQFIVFFYYVGTVRSAAEFKIFDTLGLFELIVVIATSSVLTLFVDMPVQKIKSILISPSSPQIVEVAEYENNTRKLSTSSQMTDEKS